MPSLVLTDEQALALLKQLPPAQQVELLRHLLLHHWGTWVDLSREGEERIQRLARQRGQDWTAMTDDERIAYIDDLTHEQR